MATKTFLGKHEVLTSGTIVGKRTDQINLYPLPEFPDYCLRFVHAGTRDGPDNSNNIVLIEPNLVQMELVHKWSFPNHVAVTRNVFASDSNKLYCINYYINFVGELDNYTFTFHYTIYTETAA